MVGRDLQQRLRGRPRAARVEVWCSADEVCTGGECVNEQRTLALTLGSADRPSAQRDHLDVDHVRHAAAHLDERLDAAQPMVHRRVGVAADSGEAVGGEQTGRPLGTLDRVFDAELAAGSHHRLHGTQQITGAIRHALGEERLVEVGVRLDRREREQVPGEGAGLVLRRGGKLADGVDATVSHSDVGDRSVEQRGTLQEEVSHGGALAPGAAQADRRATRAAGPTVRRPAPSQR